jgi:pimeloyl-ACP methyl ester carboxylesterase
MSVLYRPRGIAAVFLAGLLLQTSAIASLRFNSRPSLAMAVQSPDKAPAGQGVEGIWQGTIVVGAISLRLVVKISRGPDAEFTGTFDSLDQGARDVPLDSITFKDGSFHFGLKAAGAAYDGTLSKDGAEFSGHFTQGGQAFPLVFKRVDKEPETKRSQDPQKPYPYDEEEVAYDNKSAPGVRLAGTLTIPRKGGPFPVVLLITGSGPQDRNEALMGHRPFLVLSDYLTRHGIEVLRVDDRGTAKSTGDFGKATTEDFASDVMAGIDFLKTRKEVNQKQIGLIGHSEGGVIAPMVAAKSPDVAFIVMMAGTSITGEEIIYLQSALIAKAQGASDAELAKSRATQESMFAVLKQEKDSAAAEKKLREILTQATAESTDKAGKMSQAGINNSAKMFASPWFRFFADYDPKPALTKLKCPVLALNGSNDLQVPPSANLPGIIQALEAGENRDYEVDKLPRLNHLFQTSETGSPSEYSRIDETIAPIALETISNWILRHTAK